MQVLTYELNDVASTIVKVIAKAKEGGLDIDGNNEGGKIHGMGVEADYRIEGNKLIISIDKKPFFLTEDTIKSELDKYFKI
jgi:hypothetical protein